MTWTLRRTEKALDDLAAIFDYIATDNPDAAEALIARLLALFERTADYPQLGRPADDIAPAHRILTHGRYLIIYCVYTDERAVVLVRVVHGARDWPALFDD
jgi:toxin ParE1/3/4